ncbi:MAG: class I SAM-dependent methyltransferase [Patescibacteria group bacterium]|nr:class I SAM-dependent methyltransferase [Patescibacteria group bacterium]
MPQNDTTMGIIQYWNERHHHDAQTSWIIKPSIFARWALQYFPKTGTIADLGAGQGQDSRFFASRGYHVTMADFSDDALEYARQKLTPDIQTRVSILRHDITKPLPFHDQAFDIVYSHLALHYFSEHTMRAIIDEIHRVLKNGGIFAALVNSIHDPEYTDHANIEPGYLEIGGIKKRYFSAQSFLRFTPNFNTIRCDENGETYKDRAKNTNQLVRYIGKKP